MNRVGKFVINQSLKGGFIYCKGKIEEKEYHFTTSHKLLESFCEYEVEKTGPRIVIKVNYVTILDIRFTAEDVGNCFAKDIHSLCTVSLSPIISYLSVLQVAGTLTTPHTRIVGGQWPCDYTI